MEISDEEFDAFEEVWKNDEIQNTRYAFIRDFSFRPRIRTRYNSVRLGINI